MSNVARLLIAVFFITFQFPLEGGEVDLIPLNVGDPTYVAVLERILPSEVAIYTFLGERRDVDVFKILDTALVEVEEAFPVLICVYGKFLKKVSETKYVDWTVYRSRVVDGEACFNLHGRAIKVKDIVEFYGSKSKLSIVAYTGLSAERKAILKEWRNSKIVPIFFHQNGEIIKKQ